MGVARVNFVDDCDVVVGAAPDDPNQPITGAKKVGGTNTDFMMPDGLYCFSIKATPPFSPLWQMGQVSGASFLILRFTRP